MSSEDPHLEHIDRGRSAALLDYVNSLPNLSSIKDNPQAVLDAMTEFKKVNRMMTFQNEKIQVAQRVIESKTNPHPPKTIIELGTYVGHSAIAWGNMIRSWHPEWKTDSRCKVITMEASPTMAKIARSLIALAGLEETVEVVLGSSSDSLRSLKSREDITEVDMLFIDHWERYYLPDLKICEELGLLKKGTIIVADNTDMPGAPDYLEYVRSGGEGRWKYETQTYDTPIADKGPSVLEVSMVV